MAQLWQVWKIPDMPFSSILSVSEPCMWRFAQSFFFLFSKRVFSVWKRGRKRLDQVYLTVWIHPNSPHYTLLHYRLMLHTLSRKLLCQLDNNMIIIHLLHHAFLGLLHYWKLWLCTTISFNALIFLHSRYNPFLDLILNKSMLKRQTERVMTVSYNYHDWQHFNC